MSAHMPAPSPSAKMKTSARPRLSSVFTDPSSSVSRAGHWSGEPDATTPTHRVATRDPLPAPAQARSGPSPSRAVTLCRPRSGAVAQVARGLPARLRQPRARCGQPGPPPRQPPTVPARRSEEHTSELQSRPQLVCRLLLEKKKTHIHSSYNIKEAKKKKKKQNENLNK